MMVNIALGTRPLSDCAAGDSTTDGEITIDEIIRAVTRALNGCRAAHRQRILAPGSDLLLVRLHDLHAGWWCVEPRRPLRFAIARAARRWGPCAYEAAA